MGIYLFLKLAHYLPPWGCLLLYMDMKPTGLENNHVASIVSDFKICTDLHLIQSEADCLLIFDLLSFRLHFTSWIISLSGSM